MEKVIESKNINDFILQKYFRFRHSSLQKIAIEVEKFNKFKERWQAITNVENLNSDLKNNKLGKNKFAMLQKRNTLGPIQNNQNIDINTKSNLKENVWTVQLNEKPQTNKTNLKRNTINTTIQSKNKEEEPAKDRTKTFICTGGYPAIRQALVNRGWVEINDPLSSDFDLKWVLKTKDIQPASQMRKDQIVNHFLNNVEITKKSGLQKNLRNIIFSKVDIDNFYPRSYELSERNDFEDFLEDFKFMKAIAILKQFHLNTRQISEEIVSIALSIWERKAPYFETCSDEEFKYATSGYLNNARAQWLITDNEWNIISEEDMKNYSKEIEKLEKMNKIGYLKVDKKIKKNSKISNPEELDKIDSLKEDVKIPLREKVAQQISRMQRILPQYNLNGLNNIWILKPSGLSRGRGIVCMNSLNDILNLIKRNSNQYIAQKYIENPLIVQGRKFDIRQWVLVTNLDPLTIWMYDTPYVRFGAEDYKLEDFANLFSHLTNNSIVKNSDNFDKSHIEGNMWDIIQFSNYLKETLGRDVWKEQLQEKIKKIVICSMESARKNITNRKNSHELFGYDIMIDENLNAWLIEVNSSPAMDYSTSTTERLVKEMSEDLIKVVVDHNLSENKETIETGKFVKIYSGENFELFNTPNN